MSDTTDAAAHASAIRTAAERIADTLWGKPESGLVVPDVDVILHHADALAAQLREAEARTGGSTMSDNEHVKAIREAVNHIHIFSADEEGGTDYADDLNAIIDHVDALAAALDMEHAAWRGVSKAADDLRVAHDALAAHLAEAERQRDWHRDDAAMVRRERDAEVKRLVANAYSDALVLRAIAARLRARSLPPTLRRLADLDAALIEQVAGNVEGEYTR